MRKLVARVWFRRSVLPSCMGLAVFAASLLFLFFPESKDVFKGIPGNDELVAPVYRVQTKEKVIALTFDDGPHPVYTGKILKMLRDKGIRATFFLNGHHVKAHPALAKQIVLQGHEVGNHGYYHRDLTKLSPVEIYQDLAKSGELIKQITGKEVAYFRPMGGKLNRDVVASAQQLGFKIVLWSVDPKDWDMKNPASVIEETLVTEAENGDIVLLHDGGGHQETMMKALDRVIRKLQKKGFRFVTVSELLAESRQEQKAHLSVP